MKVTPEQVKDINEGFNTASTDALKDMMSPIKHVYIDLPLIVDYKLGTVLAIYKDDEDAYKYIYETVKDNYNFLVGKNITPKFPKLEITEDQINEVLKNPENSYLLSALSPLTILHDMVVEFVNDIYTNNLRFNSKEESEVHVYLNNPYFELSEMARVSFKYLFKNSFVRLYFIQDTDYTNPGIINSEYIFIDDLSLFNSSLVVQKLFSEGFVEKTICASYMSDADGGDIREEETKVYYAELEKLFNHRTDFKLIHKFIPYK